MLRWPDQSTKENTMRTLTSEELGHVYGAGSSYSQDGQKKEHHGSKSKSKEKKHASKSKDHKKQNYCA